MQHAQTWLAYLRKHAASSKGVSVAANVQSAYLRFCPFWLLSRLSSRFRHWRRRSLREVQTGGRGSKALLGPGYWTATRTRNGSICTALCEIETSECYYQAPANAGARRTCKWEKGFFGALPFLHAAGDRCGERSLLTACAADVRASLLPAKF